MMAQLDSRQLLQSVTKLIEKPDVRAFELSLVATLNELISAGSIKFCQIHDNPEVAGQKLVAFISPNETGSDQESQDTVLLESDKAFLECIKTERKVVVTNASGPGLRIIHPIKRRNSVVGFLVVECENDDPKDQEIVSILLGFYKNYVSLLHDSQRDELTGLLNRKTFDDKVMQIVASQSSDQKAKEGPGGYCLAVLDIDHFKQVNDKFGHLYGDEVLLLFARAMVEAFRGADLLFRTGGEEFVVVLKDVDLSRALTVLERFRKTIENNNIPQVGIITTSIGASMICANDLPATLIDRADRALYYAKNNGRNQTCAYEDLIAQGKINLVQEKNDVELF
jgi:diguanylate cyclase (GGDEF)-like protein